MHTTMLGPAGLSKLKARPIPPMQAIIPKVLAKTAKELGLSVSTLAKMRLYGTGPIFSKLGRRVVYRPEDLEQWITANRFTSTSEYPEKTVLIEPEKRSQKFEEAERYGACNREGQVTPAAKDDR